MQAGVTKTYGDAAFAYDKVGFTRTQTISGFNYTAEDGGTKVFLDASIYRVNSAGQYDPNGAPAGNYTGGIQIAINLLTGGGTVADGFISGNYNDTIYAYNGKAVTIYAGGGNDYVETDSGNDVIDGGAGQDTLLGLGGDDTIYFDAQDFQAGVGRLIDGGAGYDTAIWTSTTAFSGTISEDNIEAFVGNSGNDTISAGNIHLGESNSNLGATNIGTFIDGRAGNDTITGSANDDILVGGIGFDVLNGGVGGDLLQGGADNDQLSGQYGDDALWGGDGNDTLIGGLGADVLNGGAGTDTAYYYGSTAGVTVNLATGVGSGGEAAGDTLNDIEYVIGSNTGSDILTGNGQINYLNGFGGDDTIDGGGVSAANVPASYQGDSLDGGAGTDTLSYASSAQGVTVLMDWTSPTAGIAWNGTSGDVMINFENLIGSNHDDVLQGNDGVNIIDGGLGTDSIYGKGGADIFHFGELNTDVIADYQGGSDRLRFSLSLADNFNDFTIYGNGTNLMSVVLNSNGSQIIVQGFGGANVTLAASDFQFI